MSHRLGASVLLVVLLLGALPGVVTGRSASEIIDATEDATQRLAEAQMALEDFEANVDGPNTIYIADSSEVFPFDTTRPTEVLDLLESTMRAAREADRAGTFDPNDPTFTEAVSTIMADEQAAFVLRVYNAALDEAERTGSEPPDIYEAISAAAASDTQLVAEATRLLKERAAIEQELAELEAQGAAMFPPAWVQVGGQSAIVDRYGPWEDDRGLPRGPGIRSTNRSFVVVHTDEQGREWLTENCYKMEDGLSYCHEHGEPWGTYVSVYAEINGGLRRYIISSRDYCDLHIDRMDPAEGISGHYSCADGARFSVWPGGPYDFPPEVLAGVTEAEVGEWAIVEIVQVREIAAMCGRSPDDLVEVTIQDTVIYEALAPRTRAHDKVDRELGRPRSKTWTTPSACGAERWTKFEAEITESGLTAEEARGFIKAFENDPGLFAPGSGPLKVTLGAGSSRMEKAGVIWAEASGQQYDGGIERGSASADGAVQAGGGRLAAIFPTELGGEPWDELTMRVGQEIYAGRDRVAAEDDPVTALLEATGASIDDVTGAVGSVETEDGAFAYVTAIQVVGVDAERVWEFIFQPSMDESLIQPREEAGQVGGKDVRILWDDDCPECQPGHIYLSGDTAWVIIAVEPLLTEVFERLP